MTTIYTREPARVFTRSVDPRSGNEWEYLGEAEEVNVHYVRLYRRDGRRICEGEQVFLRDLSWRSLIWLVRYRPAQVVGRVRLALARWWVLPGDRFEDYERDLIGEVLAIKRDHVVMRVVPGEFAAYYMDDDPVLARTHVRIEPRDLFRWIPA